MKKLLATFFLLFIIPSLSFAADFSGSWTFNAGGYIMKLVIDQNNNSAVINGGASNDGSSDVQVNGNEITFTRTNDYLGNNVNDPNVQKYKGYMFLKGPKTMGGTWTYKGKTNGWYATQ